MKTTSRRHREPWREALLDELTDEYEDERRDFADPVRDPFESEHGPAMGSDGDDNPQCAVAKPKSTLGDAKRFDADKIDPATFNTDGPVQVKPKPAENVAGQMVDDGHGFVVKDFRSRPWKTAKRTHCAQCGGEMPPPPASTYLCEFGHDFLGCRCSGCTLRGLVSCGQERNRGNPSKCCSKECTRKRDNERGRWKRAVLRAEKRGEEPPPEPEDRGLKFVQSGGLRSSIEGHGHRYTAASV